MVEPREFMKKNKDRIARDKALLDINLNKSMLKVIATEALEHLEGSQTVIAQQEEKINRYYQALRYISENKLYPDGCRLWAQEALKGNNG